MPSLTALFHLLSLYHDTWIEGPRRAFKASQEEFWQRMVAFAESSPDVCQRWHASGHFTGSGLVTDPTMTQVLLIHHKKLGKWLQLGGHADGNPSLNEVALRECEEESGLKHLAFACELRGSDSPIPFDLDIHRIPTRKGEPEHLHYDVRFLLVADPREPLLLSEESNDLAWFSIADARSLTDEASMQRQFDKLEGLRELSPEQHCGKRPEPRLL